MSRDNLSGRERAALLALLSQAGRASNQRLEELIGFRLVGEGRRRLNDGKYVESRKQGRSFAHELTDAGWHWCGKELARGPAGRETSLERAHYLVLGVFARYMDDAALIPADVFGASSDPRRNDRPNSAPAPAPDPDPDPDPGAAVDVAARVEAAYRALAPASGEFVGLRELRLRLADISRGDLDAMLAAMYTRQRVNLIPESHQQSLSATDRESALRIGGENKHLISIE